MQLVNKDNCPLLTSISIFLLTLFREMSWTHCAFAVFLSSTCYAMTNKNLSNTKSKWLLIRNYVLIFTTRKDVYWIWKGTKAVKNYAETKDSLLLDPMFAQNTQGTNAVYAIWSHRFGTVSKIHYTLHKYSNSIEFVTLAELLVRLTFIADHGKYYHAFDFLSGLGALTTEYLMTL